MKRSTIITSVHKSMGEIYYHNFSTGEHGKILYYNFSTWAHEETYCMYCNFGTREHEETYCMYCNFSTREHEGDLLFWLPYIKVWGTSTKVREHVCSFELSDYNHQFSQTLYPSTCERLIKLQRERPFKGHPETNVHGMEVLFPVKLDEYKGRVFSAVVRAW